MQMQDERRATPFCDFDGTGGSLDDFGAGIETI